jgi:arylamine N-acetyltransferase
MKHDWKFNSVMNCDKCKFNHQCNMEPDCPYIIGWQEGQKKLTDFLFQTCPHTDEDLGGEGVTMCYRHACGQCMEELEVSVKSPDGKLIDRGSFAKYVEKKNE